MGNGVCENASFPNLFSPGKIGNCHLNNRIIMPLFPTKYATDSRVNPKMLEFYQARAKGGVALIVLDCPCLDYPRCLPGRPLNYIGELEGRYLRVVTLEDKVTIHKWVGISILLFYIIKDKRKRIVKKEVLIGNDLVEICF